MLWKAVVGMGLVSVITVSVFQNYKWAILDKLDFSFFPNQKFCSNVNEIENYINQGGNPNPYFRSSERKTLLICAIEANSQSTVELLIAKGANINDSLPYIKSVDWLKFLIAQGVDINSKHYRDQTLLHYAVINNSKEIAELLLSRIVNANAKDYNGNTPLHLAAAINKNYRKFSNSNLNLLYYHEPTFDNSGINIRLYIIKLLLKNGAFVDIRNDDNNTPLHLAARANNQDIAEYLLEKKASIDAKNKKGKTPLMFAAEGTGGVSMMKLLIESGADINAKDNEGSTVLDIAEKYGKKDLFEKIIRKKITQ